MKNITLDKEYVLKNIFIGFKKESEDELEKDFSDFSGIEKYMYVGLDGVYKNYCSVLMITEDFLKCMGISKAEAWGNAETNTCRETEIKTMYDVMKGFGVMDIEGEWIPQMYIISNRCGVRGASAMIDRTAIRKFSEEKGVKKWVVLPSSIHEMILIPYEDEMDMEYMASMVEFVNQNEVDEKEQLSDMAYLLEV